VIGITCVAYNQPDLLLKMARTASESGHPIRFYITRTSMIPQVTLACDEILEKYDAVVDGSGKNIGVSRCWNNNLIKMQEDECEFMMVVNDDIWFEPGDVDLLISAALAHRDNYAIQCAGPNLTLNARVGDHGFSCVVFNPIALETLGYFDENFFPAYNEDVDYAYRAGLAGLVAHIEPNTQVHHVGSAAIQTNSKLANQNHRTHGLNDQYWTRKWGCSKGGKGHSRPFNNQEFHPYYISIESRHEPYPGFNRADREVVVI